MTTILARILVIIAVIAMVYVNYLAARGYIGGISTSYISDKYPTQITPAGYAFSIWGLIYLGTILFSLFQLFKSDNLYRIRILFVVSCIANISWIFAWHHQFLGLSVFAITVLLGSLISINIVAGKLNESVDFAFIRLPFGIYLGWVSVAAILNLTIYLASLGFTANELVNSFTACVVILAITIIGVFVREKLSLAVYPLTIAWALTAIGVKQSSNTIIVTACAIAVISLILSSLTFILKDKKQTNE